ncbi:hypothetical protein GQ457_07G010750 [Hibiscus cannabinus]
MSSAANPLEPTAGNGLVYPGGRPADNVSSIPKSAIRERLVSPLRMGDGRTIKKGRTEGPLLPSNSEMHATAASVESHAKIPPSDADTVIVDVGIDSATINEIVKDSYASKVKGSMEDVKTLPTFLKDEVTFLDGDIITDCTGKVPSIQFSNRIHDQIDNNLSNGIIVRLLGQAIGYRALVNRVTALWKPICSLHIIDLDNNYFLVRFSDPSDYLKVLMEGPWTIYGSYLTVQPWSRQFTTTEKHPTQVQEGTDNRHVDAISELSLFGPWMVMAVRRRRGGYVRSRGPSIAKPTSGSRYASLMVDDMGEGKDQDGNQNNIVREDGTLEPEGDNPESAKKVVPRTFSKNAAYRASNPNRKHKADNKGNKPLGSKKDMVGAVRIIEHNTGLKLGDHKAVSVIEQESHDKIKDAGVGQRRRTNLGKGIVDVSRSKGHEAMLQSSDDEDFYISDSPEGAASSDFRNYFRSFVQENHPSIVALFEPRISGCVVDRVVAKLGFPHSFRVESHGFSGGIWILWNDEVTVEILTFSNQFIHIRFRVVGNGTSALLTAVYASPCRSKRKDLWNQLAMLNPGDGTPWLLGGDFNVILSTEERIGGAWTRYSGSKLFAEFLFLQGLRIY